RGRDVTAEPLPEAQANQIRGLASVVRDLASQLDRLERLPVLLEDIEPQAVPIDDAVDLSRDRIGEVAHLSGPAERRGEGLDAFELLAPASCLCEEPRVVDGQTILAGNRHEPIGLGGKEAARAVRGEREE